jgi:hypothetical protein
MPFGCIKKLPAACREEFLWSLKRCFGPIRIAQAMRIVDEPA